MAGPPETVAASARALRTYGPSVVADALRDLGRRQVTVAPGIAPVNRRHVAAGPVRTARFEPVEPDDDRGFLPLAGFIDSCGGGDVLLLAGAAESGLGSVWGEICSTAAACRGCAGVVVDGYMRDELALAEMELPVFSRGALAQDCLGRAMVAETGVEVLCGGVAVMPGDWIVASVDGVVVIPAGLLEQALEAAEAKQRAERALLAELESGRSLREAVERIGTL